MSSNAFLVSGQRGTLNISADDKLARQLAMLIEGECHTSPEEAARKFDYSKQRYYQLRSSFRKDGSDSLIPKKPGPKTNYVRTPDVVSQVIRYRFLDREASPDVIAQRLNQAKPDSISIRSVYRIFEDYGLQKKTIQVRSSPAPSED